MLNKILLSALVTAGLGSLLVFTADKYDLLAAVSSSGKPSITIKYPNGSSAGSKNSPDLYIGKTATIKWSAKKVEKIDISGEARDLHGVYVASFDIAKNVSASKGKYTWTIPASFKPGLYRIFIQSSSDPKISDGRDKAYFNLLDPNQASLQITSPMGGERWWIGKTYKISYKTVGITKVAISYIGKDPSGKRIEGKIKDYFKVSDKATTSGGSFSWKIPTDLQPGSSIRIVMTGMTKDGKEVRIESNQKEYIYIINEALDKQFKALHDQLEKARTNPQPPAPTPAPAQ